MPISVQCNSCQSTLKAPDKAAGKKLKCPKCSNAIVLPAQDPVGAGAQPVPRSEVGNIPTSRATASPQRLPLLSFEELEIPQRLRQCVEDEVGDEEIVWMGRPTPESLFSKAVIGMWAGIVLCAVFLAGIVIALTSVEGAQSLIISGVCGLFLLVLGLPLATMPVWIRWLVNYRDCYVLTPTRAIVFNNEQILNAEAKVYYPEDLVERHVSVNPDGTGSIVFSTEMVDLGERTSVRTKREKRHGGKEVVDVTYIKKRHLKAARGFGFVDVEDVEKVEATLREVLRLGPPGTSEG